MDETMHMIQQFANERHLLYRLAGKQHLTQEQRQRMDFLNYQLPILWDRHRREYAARQQPIRISRVEEKRAA